MCLDAMSDSMRIFAPWRSGALDGLRACAGETGCDGVLEFTRGPGEHIAPASNPKSREMGFSTKAQNVAHFAGRQTFDKLKVYNSLTKSSDRVGV
jgi:hypothetical protein